MPHYKINYQEGDCFVVPLRSDGYATGVIARKGRSAILLGYFFGPKLSEIPDQSFAESLMPDNAIDVMRFGDLGLVTNQWTVFGKIPDWNRAKWLMPKFVGFGSIDGKVQITTYDENRLGESIAQEFVDAAESKKYYLDSIPGYGAVEIGLTRLLDPDY